MTYTGVPVRTRSRTEFSSRSHDPWLSAAWLRGNFRQDVGVSPVGRAGETGERGLMPAVRAEGGVRACVVGGLQRRRRGQERISSPVPILRGADVGDEDLIGHPVGEL